MRIPRSRATPLLCAACLAVVPTIAKAAAFTPLGFLITDTTDANYATRMSVPLGVSGDGSTVVGWSTSNATDGGSHEAFFWTAMNGMSGMGNFSDGQQPYTSEAHGVSSDGSYISGYGTDSNSNTIAFRYNGGIFTNLGSLSSSFPLSYSNAISGDGNTVVGVSYDNSFNQRAFFYRDSNTPTKMLALPGFGTPTQTHSGSANSVNSDGSVVVGSEVFHGTNAGIQEGATVGALWTIDSVGTVTGPYELQDFTNATHYETIGNGVSADGTAAVGYAVAPVGTTANVTQAVEWAVHLNGASTTVDLPTGLGFIDGTSNTATLNSVANATSKDGSVVVGEGLTTKHNSTAHDEAFIYFASGPDAGMHDLLDFVENITPSLASGLNGWTLTDATGISSDGLTIIGTGTHPDPSNPQDNITEAFVIKIPEPTCLPLLGIGALLLRRRKARITA